MHKLTNKIINNRMAKNIFLLQKSALGIVIMSRLLSRMGIDITDLPIYSYVFLNACVSILGLLSLRAIRFWYVFPIFDILGIHYSPPINFSSFNIIMQSKFDKTSTILL